MGNEFVTIKEAAQILGITTQAVGKRLQLGDLTGIPWEQLPPEERRGRSRTYIARRELDLPPKLQQRNDWITSREAAAILGIQMQLLRYRVRSGQLTAHHLPATNLRKGWKMYFSRAEVEAACDQQAPRPVPPYLHEPSPIACAYLAGLLDGEGSIVIYRKLNGKGAISDQHLLKIAVVNTHEATLRQITKTFGGSVHQQSAAAVRHRAIFVWQASGITAYHILKAIEPMLSIKREQACLAIEFEEHLIAYNASRWHPFTDAEIEWRENQKRLISALNRHEIDNQACPLPSGS